MSLNVLEVKTLLEDTYRDKLARYVPDYDAKYKEILEKRKREFKMNRSGIKLPWKAEITEENYPYKNMFKTNQIYTVPGFYDIGGVTIEIEQIPLPVLGNTQAEKAEVSFSAYIPCECWADGRTMLANDCGVEVKKKQHGGGTNYYDAFCRDVLEIDMLILGIDAVSTAVHRLNTGLQADAEKKFRLMKI